ncbi:MAG: tetratricopeptide repeat protein, partial [Caldiserica bacterium]|nr:tetratricopeptide repeat protein [Caldisericota bacterium]
YLWNLFKLGEINYQKGNLRKAKEYFLKVLEISPHDPKVQKFLKEIQRKNKK